MNRAVDQFASHDLATAPSDVAGDWELTRVLRWFDRSTDELVGEEILRDPSLAELRSVFHFGDDHQLILCYPIERERQRTIVQRSVEHSIDRDKYEYTLECDGSPRLDPNPMRATDANSR